MIKLDIDVDFYGFGIMLFSGHLLWHQFARGSFVVLVNFRAVSSWIMLYGVFILGHFSPSWLILIIFLFLLFLLFLLVIPTITMSDLSWPCPVHVVLLHPLSFLLHLLILFFFLQILLIFILLVLVIINLLLTRDSITLDVLTHFIQELLFVLVFANHWRNTAGYIKENWWSNRR